MKWESDEGKAKVAGGLASGSIFMAVIRVWRCGSIQNDIYPSNQSVCCC